MSCSFNAQPQAPAQVVMEAGACGWALNEQMPIQELDLSPRLIDKSP
jgi:hypothetical protein